MVRVGRAQWLSHGATGEAVREIYYNLKRAGPSGSQPEQLWPGFGVWGLGGRPLGATVF